MYEDDYSSWIGGVFLIFVILSIFIGFIILVIKYPIILVSLVVFSLIWVEVRDYI